MPARALSLSPAARAQLGIFLLAYLLYSAARFVTIGDLNVAQANAGWIMDLEDQLGVAVEATVQQDLTGTWALWVLNHLYLAAQLVVLRRLWAADGQSMRDLAPRAGLDPTSLNWLVDQLEKAAFVERRRDDADRRLVRVWLTDEGRALAGEIEPEVSRWEETVVSASRKCRSPAATSPPKSATAPTIPLQRATAVGPRASATASAAYRPAAGRSPR